MNDRGQIAGEILIARCQLGDELAFRRLVEEYAGNVKYYVRRLIDNEHDADDITQQVWVAVWKQLPKLRDTRAFGAWLYRIARNIALQTRRRKHDEAPFDEETMVSEPDEVFDPEEAAAVHAALGRLALPHRDALVLRFLEGMSYEDIADVVECSVGTVRSRIHYAKKALRQIMEESRNDAR